MPKDPRTEAAALEAARLNVRAFLESQPTPARLRASLEDLPGVFSFMASEHLEAPTPAQQEAARVLEDSAAHLRAFLSLPQSDPFALRALAHSFQACEVGEVSGALLPEVGDPTPEDVAGPEAWAAWYSRAVSYGQHLEAAHYAAAWQSAALISSAGFLEDGEAEDTLARLLEVLAHPVPASPEDPAPMPLDPSLN